MLYLRNDFEQAWKGKDPFEEVEKLQGEVYRELDGRRTLRFEFNGKTFFAKIHRGIGWGEIVKNFLQFKKPIYGAENEWLALAKLKTMGVDTMTPVAYGEKGNNPAAKHSFVITEDLTPSISLEDYCSDWASKKPSWVLKVALIKKLANITRLLTEHGVTHRDYYICHFLLDLANGQDNIDPNNLTTWLIDLHRAVIKTKKTWRWQVKDVGSLYFSAMDIGLTRNDLFRFMRIYSDAPLREVLSSDVRFWRAVTKRAVSLYQKDNAGKMPVLAIER